MPAEARVGERQRDKDREHVGRSYYGAMRQNARRMSLRGEPIEAVATMPDGRSVRVWVGVPEDSYIAKRDLDTVDIELTLVGGNHLAAVNTVLEAEQVSEARALAREIVAGLESGKLEPTAAALEPFADQPR